jgi:hypothetical protein
MATIVADMSVSLDSFVGAPSGGVERVFAWYGKPRRPRSLWPGQRVETG